MENGQILDAIEKWLKGNGIDFEVNKVLDSLTVDLYLPTYRIAICLSPADSDKLVPFFIIHEIHYLFIDKKETENDIMLRLEESMRLITLNRALRYTWRHMEKKQKRKYRGTWPLNYGKFKRAYMKALTETNNDHEKAKAKFLDNQEQ